MDLLSAPRRAFSPEVPGGSHEPDGEEVFRLSSSSSQRVFQVFLSLSIEFLQSARQYIVLDGGTVSFRGQYGGVVLSRSGLWD